MKFWLFFSKFNKIKRTKNANTPLIKTFQNRRGVLNTLNLKNWIKIIKSMNVFSASLCGASDMSCYHSSCPIKSLYRFILVCSCFYWTRIMLVCGRIIIFTNFCEIAPHFWQQQSFSEEKLNRVIGCVRPVIGWNCYSVFLIGGWLCRCVLKVGIGEKLWTSTFEGEFWTLKAINKILKCA